MRPSIRIIQGLAVAVMGAAALTLGPAAASAEGGGACVICVHECPPNPRQTCLLHGCLQAEGCLAITCFAGQEEYDYIVSCTVPE